MFPYAWSVSFSADGKYALSGGGDNTVILWDAKRLTQLKKFVGHTSYTGVRSVSFSPDGKYALSSGDGARQIKIWDIASGTEWKELEGHTDNFVETDASAKFSPMANLLYQLETLPQKYGMFLQAKKLLQ